MNAGYHIGLSHVSANVVDFGD